jgi:hypothetical protein
VLALSNGTRYSILIPAQVKRACLTELRRRGRGGKSLYWLLFATALYLLLKDHIRKLSRVMIDIEYEGHSASIKEHLLNLLRRAQVEVESERIFFERIHRLNSNPPAHNRAYLTHREE